MKQIDTKKSWHILTKIGTSTKTTKYGPKINNIDMNTNDDIIEITRRNYGPIKEIIVISGINKGISYHFSHRGFLVNKTIPSKDAIHSRISYIFRTTKYNHSEEIWYYLKNNHLGRKIFQKEGIIQRIEYYHNGTCYCKEFFSENGIFKSSIHIDTAGIII